MFLLYICSIECMGLLQVGHPQISTMLLHGFSRFFSWPFGKFRHAQIIHCPETGFMTSMVYVWRDRSSVDYPLVTIQKTMENHHLLLGKSTIFTWPFSMWQSVDITRGFHGISIAIIDVPRDGIDEPFDPKATEQDDGRAGHWSHRPLAAGCWVGMSFFCGFNVVAMFDEGTHILYTYIYILYIYIYIKKNIYIYIYIHILHNII